MKYVLTYRLNDGTLMRVVNSLSRTVYMYNRLRSKGLIASYKAVTRSVITVTSAQHLSCSS